jgi:predicted secreted protein
MKNNKGSILIVVLILFIVLIIGGFLYYKEKSSNILPFNIPANNYQLPINQNNAQNTQKNIPPTQTLATTLTLTSKDNGKTFTILKEQMATITLCNPGDGGYQFDTPQYDSSVLQLTSHTNIPINNPTGYVGGCYGNDVFEFKASNAGSSKLVITASRGTTDIINMFSATIVVQGGIKPNTCTPNWQCGWGQCQNGSQSMTAVDFNNCGISSQKSPALACPALAKICDSGCACPTGQICNCPMIPAN